MCEKQIAVIIFSMEFKLHKLPRLLGTNYEALVALGALAVHVCN